jgi:hypothetical protein
LALKDESNPFENCGFKGEYEAPLSLAESRINAGQEGDFIASRSSSADASIFIYGYIDISNYTVPTFIAKFEFVQATIVSTAHT